MSAAVQFWRWSCSVAVATFPAPKLLWCRNDPRCRPCNLFQGWSCGQNKEWLSESQEAGGWWRGSTRCNTTWHCSCCGRLAVLLVTLRSETGKSTLKKDLACFCETAVRITYLLPPQSRVLLEKLTGSQLVKKFPEFYGTRKFITAFTSVRHLSLSSASSIQSIPPHPTYWRSILILSSYLRLGLPSGLFSSGCPTRNLYTPLLSPIHATGPVHLILDLINRTIFGEQYGSLSSSLRSFLHSPVTSSLLGPNSLLNILFSIILSLRSSLNVSDRVPHPYKTTRKILVLYILIRYM